MRPLDRLKKFRLIPAGPDATAILEKHVFSRSVKMAKLVPSPGQLCAWCNEKPLATYRHKYCCTDCKETAFLYCYPQSLTTRGWILANIQNCACAGCGLSYQFEIERRIERRFEALTRWKESDAQNGTRYVRWWDGKTIDYPALIEGLELEVDHIEPIFKGGCGIGLHNVQVLCKACHRTKTSAERKKSV